MILQTGDDILYVKGDSDDASIELLTRDRESLGWYSIKKIETLIKDLQQAIHFCNGDLNKLDTELFQKVVSRKLGR